MEQKVCRAEADLILAILKEMLDTDWFFNLVQEDRREEAYLQVVCTDVVDECVHGLGQILRKDSGHEFLTFRYSQISKPISIQLYLFILC